MATPSIGRQLHYIMPDGQHRPATIVKVNKHVVAALKEEIPEITVNLQVLTSGPEDSFRLNADKYSPDFILAINSGMFLALNVKFDSQMSIGSCHWPEYVE